MQAIDITKERLDKFFEIYGRYEKAEEEASNELSKAKMNSNRRVKYKNEFVEEKVLWDESRYIPNGDAVKMLREKYPKAFSSAEEQDKIGGECMSFCSVEMGIDFTKVRVSDIIRICMGVVNYMLKGLPLYQIEVNGEKSFLIEKVEGPKLEELKNKK